MHNAFRKVPDIPHNRITRPPPKRYRNRSKSRHQYQDLLSPNWFLHYVELVPYLDCGVVHLFSREAELVEGELIHPRYRATGSIVGPCGKQPRTSRIGESARIGRDEHGVQRNPDGVQQDGFEVGIVIALLHHATGRKKSQEIRQVVSLGRERLQGYRLVGFLLARARSAATILARVGSSNIFFIRS